MVNLSPTRGEAFNFSFSTRECGNFVYVQKILVIKLHINKRFIAIKRVFTFMYKFWQHT